MKNGTLRILLTIFITNLIINLKEVTNKIMMILEYDLRKIKFNKLKTRKVIEK